MTAIRYFLLYVRGGTPVVTALKRALRVAFRGF